MSWTDVNKTEPQGDWGQAAENDNGYGQGADNAIGWGVAHVLSWGHAITNLFGKLSALIAGWDLLFQSNTTEPLNTANELNGTSGGGSFIAFADLTGVTISSIVGTATLAIGGNDMDFTTSGNIRKITVNDNGVTRYFLLTEGIGNIKSSDGVLSGTLNGITWGLGVNTAISEGTQTGLIGFNNYDYFNGVSNYIKHNSNVGTDLRGRTISGKFVFNELNIKQMVRQNNLSSSQRMSIGIGATNQLVLKGAIDTKTTPLNMLSNGELVSYSFYVEANYTFSNFIVNGTLITANNGGSINTGAIGNVTGAFQGGATLKFNGIIIETIIDGVVESAATNWNGGTKIGTFSKQVTPENPLDLGNDYFGEVIQRPLLTDGYNFSGQVGHYFDSAITLTSRNADDTDGFFIKPMSNAGGEFFAGDDVVTIGSNASNKLEIVWNGVTLTGTQVMTKGNWYLIQFGQDGALLGKVWKGTELVSPIVDATGAVGTAISATTSMKYGNKDTTSTSFNGYVSQLTHYPKLLTDAEVVDNWTFLKNKAI